MALPVTTVSTSVFVQRMVHAALILSLGIYAVVFRVAFATQPPNPALASTMFPALAAVSLVQLVLVIPLLRRKMMPARAEATSFTDVAGAQVTPTAAAALAGYTRVQIVSWALCESVAMFGFVLSVLTIDFRYYIGFAVAALLNLILYRPSRDVAEAVARAADRGA